MPENLDENKVHPTPHSTEEIYHTANDLFKFYVGSPTEMISLCNYGSKDWRKENIDSDIAGATQAGIADTYFCLPANTY